MAIATIKLKEFKKEASATEKAIIDYILKNPEETSRLTIYKLAEKTYTSPSSIIRLCKKNGYSGFKEFSKELIYEQAIRTNYKEASMSEGMIHYAIGIIISYIGGFIITRLVIKESDLANV